MNLTDLDIGLDGPRVTPTGAVATATGPESLGAWVMRCTLAVRGSLIHRPDFGADLLRWLGSNSPAVLPSIASTLKAAIERDARVRAASVPSIGFVRDGRGRVEAQVAVISVDGREVSFSVRM